MMSTPKEISIHSGLNENSKLRVETVVEDEGSASLGTDEEDEGFQGNVAARKVTAARHQNQFGSGHSAHSNSNSTTSSWASKDDLRRQKRQEQKTKRGKKWSSIKNSRNRKETSVTPPRAVLKRSKTPTTNNLSGFFSEPGDSIEGEDLTASLLAPTEILYAEDGRGAVYSRRNRTDGNQQHNTPHQQQQQQPPPSSFRKWIAEGMLDTLNVVAGITLSTTGTILSPPIALTRAIIPSILAIIVDALDKATPQRLQDWFRILSSSVYHLFVVLVAGSTDRGRRFRDQITQVAHSFVEAWSAPESRQVIVDGMATGIKLTDALHTPEMKIFLDQLGILACRFGDAMASGKSKEFLLNVKDLIWTSIELASDPSTTLALAEVTAHLCHALMEVDDSFTKATSRAVRNTRNEKAYLDSSLMTKDYPFESMERIILSSLGMGGNDDERDDHDESTSDIGNGVDDSVSTEQSIPSNVAFPVLNESNPLEIPNMEHVNESKNGDVGMSNFQKYKERVDVDLLQRKILNEGRPRARSSNNHGNTSDTKAHSVFPSKTSSAQGEKDGSNSKEKIYSKIGDDMEEVPILRNAKRTLSSFEHRNPANTKELYDKFERMETKEPEKPSYVQFFTALDELMNTKRIDKEVRMRDCVIGETKGDKDHSNAVGSARKAKVRVLRKGIIREEKVGSKAVREKYSNLRRRWNYPSSFLQFGAIWVLVACMFWVGFGIYGMYALFHQVFHQGVTLPTGQPEPLLSVQQPPQQQKAPVHNLDFRTSHPSAHENLDNRRNEERTNNYRPNEIVIRIVKEVVHVHQDGTRIESYEKANDANLFQGDIRQNNHDGTTEVTIPDDAEETDDNEIEDLYEKDVNDALVADESSAKAEKNDRSEDEDSEEIMDHALDQEEIKMIQGCIVSSLEVRDDPSSYDNLDSLNREEIDRVKECISELE